MRPYDPRFPIPERPYGQPQSTPYGVLPAMGQLMQGQASQQALHTLTRPGAAGGQRRKRASKPKVRTGCITCKIRRIKCDETKPACGRCTSTGRKCDGYEFVSDKPPESGALVLSTSRTNTTVATTRPESTPQFSNIVSNTFEGDSQERRIFHRFQVCTIPAFAGGSEATFWNGLVLRVGQQEPVVRNAIIALGTLHEDYQLKGGVYSRAQIAEPSHQHALRLYGKALRQLNERLNRGNRTSAKLAIIASVLFTCFEVLRRNNMAAVIHYSAGMREIVRQINMNESQATSSETASERGTPIVQEMPQTELDDILRVFARYDIQACTFVKPRAEPVNVNVSVVPPESFTLAEVKRHLDNLLISAYQLVKSDLGMYRYWPIKAVPQEWVYQRDEAVQTFENWMAALEQYFQTTTQRLSPSELKSLLGLRMQIKVAIIQLKTCIDCGPESTFDMFLPEFQDIVTRVDQLTTSLQLREGPPLSNEATPFTMELGIIHPLFFVATKCRHYRVRRRAINLLKRSGREGIFEGPIMAIIALQMARMEEEGVLPGSVVPERNRIHNIRNNVDYEKSMVMLELTRSLDEWGGTSRSMIPSTRVWNGMTTKSNIDPGHIVLGKNMPTGEWTNEHESERARERVILESLRGKRLQREAERQRIRVSREHRQRIHFEALQETSAEEHEYWARQQRLANAPYVAAERAEQQRVEARECYERHLGRRRQRYARRTSEVALQENRMEVYETERRQEPPSPSPPQCEIGIEGNEAANVDRSQVSYLANTWLGF